MIFNLKFFYGMVVIGSLSMVGDGGGCEGCWEGVGRALGERWGLVRVGPGSLIYRKIKSLHCSGYLLVHYNNGQLSQMKFGPNQIELVT